MPRPRGRLQGNIPGVDAMLWLRALYAIAIVAALLVVLNYILRTIQRGGTFGMGERMVEVLETTPLANASALHLVRIAEKFYVIGGSQAQASLLCEVPADAVEPWRRTRKTARPAAPLSALVARYRKPPPEAGGPV
jgi:flagellar biogenesis protein FliO